MTRSYLNIVDNHAKMVWLNILGYRRSMAWAVIVGLLLAIYWYFNSSAASVHSINPLASLPNEMIVEEQVLQSMLSVTGTIEAGETVSVTAPFDGAVDEKRFSFDSQVERGQILLVLDSRDIELRIQESKVSMLRTAQALSDIERWDEGPDVARSTRNVLTAKLALEETQRKVKESEVLLNFGIIPRLEYDALFEQMRNQEMQVAAAQDELKNTRATVNRASREIARIEAANAQAKYDDLKRSLDGRLVKAPLDGVISLPTSSTAGQSMVTSDRGSHIVKGQALFNISSSSKLIVGARVDEVDVTQLSVGQPVDIVLDSPNIAPVQGRLAKIAAQALPNIGGTPKSGLFEIKVEVLSLTEAQLSRIRVGMSCNLSIGTYNNSHAIIVPLSFVYTENGLPYVLIPGESGGTQKRAVVPGHTTESGVEILEGLRSGDRVILKRPSEI